MFSLKLSKNEEDRAREIHEKSIVIDMLSGDPPRSRYSDKMIAKIDEWLDQKLPPSKRRDELEKLEMSEIIDNLKVRNELYLGDWEKSGVTCISTTLNTNNLVDSLKSFAPWIYKFDNLKDNLVKVTSANDIEKAKKEKKHSVIFNFQNTTNIGWDVDLIDLFYWLGIRIWQLTYNPRNYVGTGCTERNDSGISEFGCRVIERMNKLGILVDVSHCGYLTTMDALNVSKKPVAFTHSLCKAVRDYPRGKTDEQIKAMAEQEGVMGIVTVPFFVNNPWQSTLDDVLNHVEHVINLVGINYVGIATDHGTVFPKRLSDEMNKELLDTTRGVPSGFRPEHQVDFNETGPKGMQNWTEWPNITRGLVSRGYSDQDIKKVLGENWIRLFKKVWK